MSTVSSSQRASRRQSQDGSVDKVVVNLDASSPVAGSRRGVSTSSSGARSSPIDLEALADEVLAVSPSQVPPQRRNRRPRRQSVMVIDLEVDASQEGNKRQRIAPVIHLSLETGEGSSLQSNNAPKTSKEPAKLAPKELEQVGGALHNNLWPYLLHELHQTSHPGPEEMSYLPEELEEQFSSYLPSELCWLRV